MIDKGFVRKRKRRWQHIALYIAGLLAWPILMGITLSGIPKNIKIVDNSLAGGPVHPRTPSIPTLELKTTTQWDGLNFIVESSVFSGGTHFDWSLDGKSAASTSEPRLFSVFPMPGIYEISVDAKESGGKTVAHGVRQLKVSVPDYISSFVPDDNEGSTRYLVVDAPDGSFAIEGEIVSISGFLPRDQALIKQGKAGSFTIYRAAEPGYYQIVTRPKPDSKQTEIRNVFISPLASRHVDRSDRDWYLTQFNTETQSNCGPTVAAMSIRWARGTPVSVVEIRHMMGWDGDGGVSIGQLQQALANHGVKSRLLDLQTTDDMLSILSRGHLLAVSYNMAGITQAKDPSHNLLGQYYTDAGGHYLALKGYSLDGQYVVVYDPIPSDWADNRLRYGDGVTMIGRNRYYPINELWKALRTTQALEILPD